jgi:hypothetical protein
MRVQEGFYFLVYGKITIADQPSLKNLNRLHQCLAKQNEGKGKAAINSQREQYETGTSLSAHSNRVND